MKTDPEDVDRRRDRLKKLCDERTQTVVSSLTGISLSQLGQWLSGERNMTDGSGKKIARRMGLPIDYFEAARAARTPEHIDIGNASPVQSLRSIPVISWVAAGHWEEAFDPYAAGACERTEHIDESVSRLAFALDVRGDSMEAQAPGARASFPPGCVIVIDPTRQPKSGDFVVVRNNDWDQATFKQLVIDGGIRYLKPINPAYPTMQIPPGTVMVGVVVMKLEKQRF